MSQAPIATNVLELKSEIVVKKTTARSPPSSHSLTQASPTKSPPQSDRALFELIAGEESQMAREIVDEGMKSCRRCWLRESSPRFSRGAGRLEALNALFSLARPEAKPCCHVIGTSGPFKAVQIGKEPTFSRPRFPHTTTIALFTPSTIPFRPSKEL